MDKKSTYWMITSILVVFYSVSIFVIPTEKNAVFWIAYSFSMIAGIIQVLTVNMALKNILNPVSRFFGWPILKAGYIYIIVQMLVSLIFILMATFVPVWLVVISEMMILAFALIGLIAVEATRDEVVKQYQATDVSTTFMDSLKFEMGSIASRNKEKELVNVLNELVEIVKYSDPVSSKGLLNIENQIKQNVAHIQSAIEEKALDKVKEYCEQCKQLLDERNIMCKAMKGIKNT